MASCPAVYNTAMAWRSVAVTCLCALLLASAFVFLHTGERADSVCMSDRFVTADGVSLWPPGARCTFGEPSRTDVLLNPWFALAMIPALVGSVVSLALRSART
jgi:hypothetical protein